MKKIKMVDLFAGFGGFSLAGHWMGWETLLFCENANYPKKVLNKNFPGIPIHDDIKNLTKQIIEKEFIKKYGYYDPDELIFTAGVPCQPASQAGKRKGTKDDRWLWNPTLRIVREVKPSYAVFENVPGLLSLENGRPFEEILNALESYGYQVESFVIPACSVGAWHRRDRVWIIAYADINSKSNVSINERQRQRKLGKDVSNKRLFQDTNSRRRSRKTGIRENDLRRSESKKSDNIINSASERYGKDVSDTSEQGLQRRGHKSKQQKIQQENGTEHLCNDANTDKFNDDNSGHGTGKISQFKTSRIFEDITNAKSKGLEGANSKRHPQARGRNMQLLRRD